MKPTARLLSEFFAERFGAVPGSVSIKPLGRGSHGQGFRVAYESGDGLRKRLIVKKLESGIGLGHDYPSDRAGVFLLAMENYSRLPGHVRAVDVLALRGGKEVFSISGGREYYLVMEEARGTSYFRDLEAMGEKASLDAGDIRRIRALAGYLGRVHAKKRDNPALYYRKLRDTIGHGECLMGVFDTYSNPMFTNLSEMADIEKGCVDWRARLKPYTSRLCRIHGDFHPGNILFKGPARFVLLDRSRGEYGEAADDVTALTINYVFFSLIRHERMAGAYQEAISVFFGEYAAATGDGGILGLTAPFFAFRGAVVANPMFYPDVSDETRARLFGFVHGVLRADVFDPAKVNRYIAAGLKYRRKFFNG